MSDVRATYLATARRALDLIARPEVALSWDRPSALDGMDVAALSGHLARAVLQVEAFLDGEQPAADATLDDVVSYYLDEPDLSDRESPSNIGVRVRGAETAADGHAPLIERTTASLERLTSRVPGEPADRTIVAFGHAITLDEYLRSRLVEIVVHVDDLAVSIEVEPPPLPPAAVHDAIDVLVGIAVGRIGATAAIRALTRRERAAQVLRAF